MSTESHPMLRKFTENHDEPVEHILKRALPYFRGLGEKATVQLRVLSVGNAQGRATYTIALTPGGAYLHKIHPEKPALVVIMTSEAFQSIADGSYSPVQAYHDGKIELFGNADLAQQIVAHLSVSGR